MRDWIESEVGGYRLVRQLGEGGMGAVYEGVDASGRHVAIKVLLPHLSRQPEVVARFFNEAHAIQSIGHPGVVQVFDMGQLEDQSAYMVMELLQGMTLTDRLKRGPLGEHVATVTRDIAEALAAAHRKGVVHRDLKPDNVMILEGPSGPVVKVLDFGIAKIAADAELRPGMRAVHTKTGSVMGTPAYMSPEQCRGERGIDAKTDVYSLGALLYHVYTGAPPFSGTLGEILMKHIMDPPRPLEELAPNTPVPLANLIRAMLEKRPDMRPTMDEVVTRMERFTAATMLGETRAPASLPRRPSDRRGAIIAVLAVVAFAAIGIATWLALRSPATVVKAPDAPAPAPGPAPSLSPPPAAKKILWLVKSDPAGADVVRASDGVLLGRTPYMTERPAEPGTIQVVLRRPGYREERTTLDLSADATVALKLTRHSGHRPREQSKRDDDLDVEPLQ